MSAERRHRLVAQFFRYLNRPVVLRRHPFARKFFAPGDAGDDLTAAVLRVRVFAMEAIRRVGLSGGAYAGRRMEILQRCELLREKQANVARDLSLSERQFYRELLAARRAVYPYLTEAQNIAVSTDRGANQLQRVRSLTNQFFFREAIATGTELVAESGAGGSRVEALDALAGAHAESADEAGTDAIVRELLALADGRMWMLAAAERYRARARHLNGKTEAASIIVRALAAVDALRDSSEAGRRAWALLFYDGAVYEEIYGERTASEHFTRLGNALFDSLPRPDEQITIRRLQSNAHVHMSDGRFALALNELDAARERALDAKASGAFADIAMSRAAALAMCGRLSHGCDTALSALRTLDGFNVPERAWFELVNAQLHAMNGQVRRAIQLVPRTDDSINSAFGALRVTLLADCMSKIGRSADARRLHESAIPVLRRHGAYARLGYALAVVAVAAFAGGETALAREAIAESVELLARCGNPAGQMRALASSARITRNRRHARAARAIELGMSC